VCGSCWTTVTMNVLPYVCTICTTKWTNYYSTLSRLSKLTELRYYIQLNTKRVSSDTLFTSTDYWGNKIQNKQSTHIRFTLSGHTRVSRYHKGKTNLDLLEQETVSGSGISWAICKSALSPRQITTPAPTTQVFCRQDALPAAQPTVSNTEGTNKAANTE